MSIDPVPDLEKLPYIRDAYKNKKLIIFVGSGVSALWGCKRWNGMATSLIEACYKHGKINYWEHENILRKYSYSPRKLITIAKNILAEEYIEEVSKHSNLPKIDV